MAGHKQVPSASVPKTTAAAPSDSGSPDRTPKSSASSARRVGLAAQRFGAGIRDDPDDLERSFRVTGELHCLPVGIHGRKVSVGKRLIGDRHARSAGIVGGAEHASLHELDAHHREIVRRDRATGEADLTRVRTSDAPWYRATCFR